MAVEYGAIIGGISGGVIALLGYVFVTRWLNKKSDERELKKEEQKRLYAHFDEIYYDVQNNIAPFVSSLKEINGRVRIINKHGHQGSNIELPILSESFRAHFPSDATKLTEYNQRIQEHNKKCDKFYLNIEEEFKTKGLEIVPATKGNPQSPCIYDNIFTPIFEWWHNRQYQENLLYNMEKIETISNTDPNNLYVSGYGVGAIAYAKNDKHRDKCKEAILEVARNKDFQFKAANLIETANNLVDDVNKLKKELSDTLKDLKKLDLKISGYVFKIEADCPRCREIFG